MVTMNLGLTPQDPNAPLDPLANTEMAMSPTGNALAGMMDPEGKIMDREDPELSRSREALVKAWSANLKQAKERWKDDFKRMRSDQEFARGKQWPNDPSNSSYVVNITLRHIQQRVAALYAKNPKAVARRRERLLSTVWDGNSTSLKAAMEATQMAMQAQAPQVDPMTGAMTPPMPVPPELQQAAQMAEAVIQDAAQVHDQIQQLNRISKTLEILYDYNIAEQLHPFKTMMKMMVRRSVTTGVGYVKLGFQRLMEVRPEVEARIADISNQLATMEQLSADIADGEIDHDAAAAEQLRLLVQDLEGQKDHVVREGLIFDYPTSTSIIPDPKCVHLREFLGADWVAQEYMLSSDEIKKIYKVDVGKSFNSYKRADIGQNVESLAAKYMGDSLKDSDSLAQDVACVWEIYNKTDGLVYVVCDGYKDFLREPAAPEIYMERFYPWFAYVTNECDNEKTIFPPSDVTLIRHPQMEINRSREGLREHRVANRPLTVTAQGMLDEDDLAKLQNRPANAVVELNALQPGQKVEDLLQPLRGPGIDPNMYETNGAFEDILRSVGTQEANLGGTSNSTATESSIAQASMSSSLGSSIDDLNDVLTQLARAAGQILLLNVSKETVTQIVGPGAVWPEMSAQDVAQEIFLEIEANSTGRPNQAEEIQKAEKIVPLLLQIPGINPEFIAKELLRRMGDRFDMEEAFTADLPSIVAMNSAKGLSAPGGGAAPGAMTQGPQGAGNAQQPPPMNSQGARPPSGPPQLPTMQ
jgi:hypothetical protein